MKKWLVVIILAVAQFVMILDSTVMNVSISTVSQDLSTTISGMQAAITFYALTMAAFMLVGGKLGDKWGRLKAFRIGAVIYGLGSLTTALAPNLAVLLIGWSAVEGLGAVLVIPAIAALAAINYSGKDRVVAFSILGAVTGLAAAVGPIIGGFVTTYLSWRYVFAAETLIMILVLVLSNKINDQKVTKKIKIDIPSATMAATGMAFLVFGILQSKTWGWVNPTSKPIIDGEVFAPFGMSIVVYLILGGVVILWLFWQRQIKLTNSNKQPLLKTSLLSIPVLRSGLSTLLGQYFAIAALFFVIPVYLQTILGYDALQTGIKLLPLSIGLVLFSAIGSKMSTKRASRKISRYGQLAMAVGVFFVLASVQPELQGIQFWFGMFIVGSGFGLLASQLGNVNMSSVKKSDTAEVGGLQGTYQNLGTSFGTAIAGSVFMLLLASGFSNAIMGNPDISQDNKNSIVTSAEAGIQIVSPNQTVSYAIEQGADEATAQSIADDYQQSQIDALRSALFVVFIAIIGSLALSRNLPGSAPNIETK